MDNSVPKKYSPRTLEKRNAQIIDTINSFSTESFYNGDTTGDLYDKVTRTQLYNEKDRERKATDDAIYYQDSDQDSGEYDLSDEDYEAGNKRPHMNSSNSKRQCQEYVCKICGGIYDSHQALGGHMKIHNNAASSKKAVSMSTNSGNTKGQRKFQVFSSDDDDYKVVNYNKRANMRSSNSKEQRRRQYDCKICGGIYDSHRALDGHMKTHNKVASSSQALGMSTNSGNTKGQRKFQVLSTDDDDDHKVANYRKRKNLRKFQVLSSDDDDDHKVDNYGKSKNPRKFQVLSSSDDDDHKVVNYGKGKNLRKFQVSSDEDDDQ